MSRIVLKSSNTAVILGEYPAFKTTDDSGSLFASVQSASFGFNASRQKANQLGDKNLIVDDLIRHPDVDLSLSYIYSPTYANEGLMGLSFSLDEKSELSLLSSLKDKSYNFYFYNNPEQGEDGIQSIKEQNFLPGGEIISFGNAHLSSYGLNFQVGSLPEVSVSFLCSNVESEKYFGSNVKSPAINLESGNNSGVGNFDITKTKIVEEKFFGDIYNLDRSNLPTPTPSELDFTLQDLQIGGQKISPGNHILNSFKFDMNMERASYYKLGSNYACGREIKYPVNAKISLSSLVNGYENGFISGLLYGDEVSFLNIVATDCSGIITSKLFFENLKVEKVQYDMLVNESMNYSLEMSLQINDEEGFKSYVTEEDWKATRVYDSSGVILDFKFGNIPSGWKNNQDDIYKLRFADFGSYEVGNSAFFDCNNISGKLFVPRNVNYIGESSFQQCSSISELFFDTDHSIQQIGSSGFKGCSGINIDNLLLPTSLETLGQSSFEGCSSIKGLNLNKVSTVGDRSFFGCLGLKGPLVMKDGLTYLGDSSFESCLGLDGSIEFPDSLGYINQKAFKNCGSLEYDLEINDSISGIGPQAFYGCSGLNGSLVLSENLTYIESGTFYNCFSVTGDLVLPDGVSGVGEYAFYNLGVDSLYLPESLLYISEGAFQRLNDIKTDLELPKNLLEIGDEAFADCDSFEEKLVIPSGIQSIGENAFSGCIGINDVYINSPASIFQGNSAFYGVGGCLYVTPIYYQQYLDLVVDGRFQGMPVCYGSEETIVFDVNSFNILKIKRGDIPSNWYSNQTTQSLLVVGDTCKKIQANAFVDSVGLIGGLNIPSGVEFIGQNAFRNCSFSGDLIIDDTVTGIGSGAFDGCSGFDGNLQIPYYLDILYQDTFRNCSNLSSSLVLPPRVTRIERSVFQNCSNLNGFIGLPAQCEYIGVNAFSDCSSVSGGLTFPETLTGIDRGAFKNCSSLDGELDFNGGLISIEDSGFYNCSSLRGTLLLPPNLYYLGEYSFYNCFGLSGTLDLPEFLENIEISTFENCSGLQGDLVIPKASSGVGDRAFYNCIGLSGAVVITDIAAQNIGVDSFLGTDFSLLVVHDNVEDISSGEFDYFKTQEMGLALQNGLLSVSDYAFENYAFSGDFVLPITVSNIGIAAFKNVAFNGEYSFSEGTITGIGSEAFKNCSGISGSLVFSNSLLYIGDEAFRNNTSVNGELSLPDIITGIGSYAFANNNLMTGSINLPNTLSGLGQGAFLNCSSMDGVINISTNPFLTQIETETFKNCSSINGDLLIPDNITSIGFQAFKNCSSLSGTITLTDIAALSLVGQDALDESDFQHLVISNFVEEISNGEFDYFSNRDLSLTLSENTTGILDGSFDNYSVTGNIVFPSGLLKIGNDAFKFCGGLNSGLVFPESINEIGDSAFEECTGLSGDLTLPIGLPTIGARSFYNCTGLEGILTISDLTASSVTLLDDSFFGTNFYLLKAESFDGTISDTEFDVLASNFTGSLEIGQSVSLVDNDAFDDYSFLGGFSSSGSLSTIGDRAFSGVQFSGAYEPEFVTQLGDDSFRDCGFNSGAFFYDSTEIIGNRAFLNCTGFIGDLKLTSSLISVGDYSFFNCTGFNGEFSLSQPQEEILDPIFDTTLSSVGQYAFVGCTGLSGNLIIPGQVTSIGRNAFQGMISLDGYLYLGSGLGEIKIATFKDCSNLSGYDNKLIIPRPVSHIRQDAFNGCSSLQGSLQLTKEAAINTETNAFLNTNFDNITVLSGASFISDGDFDYFQSTGVSLTLNEDLVHIREDAFDGFNFVGSITIPSYVSGIGKRAFSNNAGLQGSLTIPYETRVIDDFAFSGCFGLNSLSFYNYELSRVDDIGSGAFKNCYGFSNQLILPSPMKVIKSGAFQGCSGFIGDLVIPDDLDEIGEHAFSGCTGINGVFIDTLPPNVFTVEQGKAFEGVSGFLSLGVLVYSQYAPLSTDIGGQLWFQGMPISGVGASESIFYSGAVGDYNILNRAIQDSIDVVTEGQSYVIPDYWKNPAARTAQGMTSTQPTWFELGALCEKIGDFAFQQTNFMQGSLNLAGDLRIIGESAFSSCSATGLTLGGNIEVIKTAAFASCTKIESDLIFKSNLTGIESAAFQSCNKIKNITFLPGIKEIGNNAFQYCSDLGLNQEVAFPSTLESIGNSAFFSCSDLDGVVFGNPDLVIGTSAFNGCSSLKEINLPANITQLGDEAFNGCTSAAGNVDLPSTLVSIGTRVFNNCTSLESISTNGQYIFGQTAFRGCTSMTGDFNSNGLFTVPDEVVQLGGYLENGSFQNTRIKEILFPNNFSGTNVLMTLFYQGVFASNPALEKVTYKSGLDVISEYKYEGCTSLSGVHWDEIKSLTGIERNAFQNCYSLDSLYIPENLVEVGTSAFSMATINSQNVRELIFEPSGNLRVIGNSAFQNVNINFLNLPDVPYASGYSLGNNAFNGCSILDTLTIPDAVSGMGDGVFQNCSSITGFTWPSTLATIPNNTFYSCGLKEINIPLWVNHIGQSAFRDNYSASGTLNIHNTVVSMGNYAFRGNNIKQLLFNNNPIIDIPLQAFRDSASLSGTVVLNRVGVINSNAFTNSPIEFIQWNDIAGPNYLGVQGLKDMTELTGMSLPSGLTAIGNNSFQECIKLKEIDFSDTQTVSIGSTSFYGCSSLTGANLNNGQLTTIGNRVFESSNMEYIEIPQPVSFIDYYSFRNCTNLKDINFSTNQLTEIKFNTFENSFHYGPNSITFPTSLNTIGSDAFKGSNISGVVDLSQTNLNSLDKNTFRYTPLLEGIKYPPSMEFVDRTGCADSSIVWVSGSGLTSLHTGAFKDSVDFSGFIGAPSGLPDSLRSIQNDVFVRCASIKPRQNYLISGNIESIGNFNWYQQASTQSVIIHESFSGSIGDDNWSSVGNLGNLSIKFDNATASIGSRNWKDCDLINNVYIDCPYSVWVGTNNFDNASNCDFFIKNTHHADYISNNWSGLQGVNAISTISSYIP